MKMNMKMKMNVNTKWYNLFCLKYI
jgi:hypothetical protein